MSEEPLLIDCAGDRLVGILHRPANPARRGVLIIVGGPQYRVGSHRQFLLLARHLAGAGIPVLRFDYRGMGDSDGRERSFEHIRRDIRCAADRFFDSIPDLREVALWGLCDAASAALMYAHEDSRVTGIVLLNPWVRSDATLARAYLRHYYRSRLGDRDLWMRLLTGRINPLRALGDLFGTARTATRAGEAETVDPGPDRAAPAPARPAFTEAMREGLARFDGRVLVILSGEDLTAAEFRDMVAGSRSWRKLLDAPGVSHVDFPDATHTFSRRVWRDRVAACTAQWVTSW